MKWMQCISISAATVQQLLQEEENH